MIPVKNIGILEPYLSKDFAVATAMISRGKKFLWFCHESISPIARILNDSCETIGIFEPYMGKDFALATAMISRGKKFT